MVKYTFVTYHVFAVGSIWLTSDPLWCLRCNSQPRTIVNVLRGEIQRPHNNNVLVLAEVHSVPSLRGRKKKCIKKQPHKLEND